MAYGKNPSGAPCTRASAVARRAFGAAIVWGVCSACVGCVNATNHGAQSASDLKSHPPASFEVDGAPLCFVGANNYYVTYKPKPMVDDIFGSARAMGVKVVRIWGFIDRGSLDGSVRNTDGDGAKDGIYFQAWDPETQHAVYNDGPNGLQKLDYALTKAQQLGLKVVVVLTNNWREFGGIDQYLAWYGLSAHRDFYTVATVKQAYEDWLSHLVLHENSLSHRLYRDDPTIFAWELGNEPRADSTAPTAVLTGWATQMSSYLKSIDPNHMVAVGDEGFLDAGGPHWTYRAQDGVDHRALTAIPGVDYGTFHMYPDDWGTPLSWADRWISEHESIARGLGKPTVLEEYGVRVSRDSAGRISGGLDRRLSAYARWNTLVADGGGNAAMFWMLAGAESAGGLYKDYDGYSVYRGDETSHLLSDFARRFSASAPACAEAGAHSRNPSPFVRVRRPVLRAALSWLAGDG